MNEQDIHRTLRRPDPEAVGRFERLVRAGRLTRRELIARGLGLGLATPAIAGILAACAAPAQPAAPPPAVPAAPAAPAPAASPAAAAPPPAAPPAPAASPAAAALAASGAKGGQGTFVLGAAGDPKSFTPDYQIDDFGYPMHCNIYSMLIALDADYNILPELAKTWKVSDDGKTITFNLVSGAKWHDGQPVTSADCKWTLEKILAQPGAPGKDNLSAIDTVEAPEPAMLILKLKAPSSPLLGFLSWYGTHMLPKHVYDDGTDWVQNPAGQKPIGSGPFKFVAYKSGDNIALEANKEYFGDGPYLDKLIYRIIPDSNTALQAFLNGEVDELSAPTPPLSEVPRLQGTPGVKVWTRPAPSVYYLGCNMTKEPVSKLVVRKAISQAIDRKQIVDRALNGFGEISTTFYTTGIDWAANRNPDAMVPQYDKAAAMQALDAAGFPAKDGVRMKLVFPYFTASSAYVDMAAVVKEQLRAVDIDCELVALEIGAWQERVQRGDYDIALLNGFQGPDPANLKNRVGTKGGVNLWEYSNADIDRLLEEGATLIDQKLRAEKYFAVQKQLAVDLPIIPLSGVYFVRPYKDTFAGLYYLDSIGKVGQNRQTLVKKA